MSRYIPYGSLFSDMVCGFSFDIVVKSLTAIASSTAVTHLARYQEILHLSSVSAPSLTRRTYVVILLICQRTNTIFYGCASAIPRGYNIATSA